MPTSDTDLDKYGSTDGSLAQQYAEIATSEIPLPAKCLAIIAAWRADKLCSPYEMACQALETIEALAKKAPKS